MLQDRLKKSKFKKRWVRGILLPQLRWGTEGFFLEKQYNFELIYFAFLKRTLKKKYIAKRKFRKSRRLWFFLKKNSPISKKSKNARMGKGKGSNLRWVIRFKKNFIFAEAQNLNFFLLRKVCFFVEKKIKMKLNYIKVPLKKQSYLGSASPVFFYSLKYKIKVV